MSMSQSITWEADDLLTLGQELQQKIKKAHQEYQRAQAAAQSEEDYEGSQKLYDDTKEAIEGSFREKVAQLSDAETRVVYDHDLAGVDMDRLVYSGDRTALIEMLSDPRFAFSVNQALSEQKPYNARKELLTRGLKLTKSMAPMVYDVVGRCVEALQLCTPVEVYVYQDGLFNAACYPPMKDKVLLMVTSALLEKFTEDELAFVIGHEIGHYLFEHTRYPIHAVMAYCDPTPLDAMRVYAWKRNAELTADRVGMVCSQSFPAVASSFFKLSSGVTGARLKFRLDEYLAQLGELQGEMAEDDDPEVWYSTHPFSPLRIKALDVFIRGATYREVVGATGGEGVSDEETEKQLAELMAIMEPSYLRGDTDVKEQAKRYMLTAGYLMAAINGVVEDTEIEALLQIMGEDADREHINEVARKSADEVRDEVVTLGKALNHLLDPNQKMQMVQDLAIISYADGHLDDVELECLHWMAEGLDVPSHFVDHVLMNASAGVD